MSVNSINVGSYYTASGLTQSATQKTASVSTETSRARVDTYQATVQDTATEDQEGVIYQPNTTLVDQLKEDLQSQHDSLLKAVKDMLTKQGIAVAEGEGVWKQIAEGNYEVDEETRAAAQASIADGGYWSVEKTSERLIKFAKALVGGDPSKAEYMREAFQKGYEEAEKVWGGTLPDISQKTYDTTMKLFDEWAAEGE